MKKKNLNLKTLKVQSFVTGSEDNANTVKGGSYLCETEADPFFCGGYGGGGNGGGGTGSCGCSNTCNTCNCSATCYSGCNSGCFCNTQNFYVCQ